MNKLDPQLNRKYWALAIPILIEFLIAFMVPVVDTYFLSFMSTQATLAVGAVFPLIVFCDVLFGGLTAGGKALAAQALGKGDEKLAKRIFSSTLTLLIILALLTAILFISSLDAIVALLGLTGETAELTKAYLLVLGTGYGVLGLRFIFQIMNALYGIVKFNIGAAAILFVVNVIGNALVAFDVFGAGRFGIQGIAATSLIAAACTIFYLVIVQLKVLGFSIAVAWPSKDTFVIAKRASKVSLPSMVEPISIQLFLLFISAILARTGEVELAVRVYCTSILIICSVPAITFSVTSQILVGNYIGAGQYHNVQRLMSLTLKSTLVFVGVLSLLATLFTTPLVGMFNSDVNILQLAAMAMIPLAIAEFLKSSNTILASNLKSTGDGGVPTAMTTALTWLLIAPIMWFGLQQWGLLIAFWFLVFDEGIKCAYNLWRWRQGNWKKGLIHGLA